MVLRSVGCDFRVPATLQYGNQLKFQVLSPVNSKNAFHLNNTTHLLLKNSLKLLWSSVSVATNTCQRKRNVSHCRKKIMAAPLRRIVAHSRFHFLNRCILLFSCDMYLVTMVPISQSERRLLSNNLCFVNNIVFAYFSLLLKFSSFHENILVLSTEILDCLQDPICFPCMGLAFLFKSNKLPSTRDSALPVIIE